MIQIVFVLIASALLIEGSPAFPSEELIAAARKENWEQFQKLLRLNSFGIDWPPVLSGSVESLQPSDGIHVYGHSVSGFKEWRTEDGNFYQDGKGLEVENIDGQVSKRKFKY